MTKKLSEWSKNIKNFLYDENGKLNHNYVISVKHGDPESDEDSSEKI